MYAGKEIQLHVMHVALSVILCTPVRTLRSSSQHLRRVPTTRRTNFYSNRTFLIVASKIWNNLPSHIHAMTYLSHFKNHLRTYIFKSVNGALWIRFALFNMTFSRQLQIFVYVVGFFNCVKWFAQFSSSIILCFALSAEDCCSSHLVNFIYIV